MVLAACGGGGGDSGADAGPAPAAADATTTPVAPEVTDTTAPAADEPSDQSGEQPSNGGSGDANKASVTIGDGTYDFDVELSFVGRCEADFFGAFWVIAAASDGSNGALEMFIVPDGNTSHEETSRVNVNLKDVESRDWHADADGGGGVAAGESSVDSFTIDGNTVSGTASFVDIYAGDGATAQGTFTATCP